MKSLFGYLLLIAIIYLTFQFGFKPLGESYLEISNKYTERIGKEFIYKKDTLTIINSSSWNGTFTLDNGMVVSGELIFNQSSK